MSISLPLIGGFDSSNPPGVSIESERAKLLFSASTKEIIYRTIRLPDDFKSGLTLNIQYSMSNSSGSPATDVVWGCEVMAITPGDSAPIDTDSYDTVNTLTHTAPTITGYVTEASIPLANLDSAVAGDYVSLKIYRDAANGSDTATGIAWVSALSLEYAREHYINLNLTNGDFETGDTTGWTTITGTPSIGISGWESYAASGSSYAFIGATQSFVSLQQDIDISSYVGRVKGYEVRARGMKNFADTDRAILELRLVDTSVSPEVEVTKQILFYPNPDASFYQMFLTQPDISGVDTARVKVSLQRLSGTNNNSAVDDIELYAIR